MADEGSGRPSRRATLTLLVPVSILDLTGRGTFEQATVQCAPQLVCQTQRDHWTYRLQRLALGTLRVPLGGGPGLVLVTWKPEVVSVPEPPPMIWVPGGLAAFRALLARYRRARERVEYEVGLRLPPPTDEEMALALGMLEPIEGDTWAMGPVQQPVPRSPPSGTHFWP